MILALEIFNLLHIWFVEVFQSQNFKIEEKKSKLEEEEHVERRFF